MIEYLKRAGEDPANQDSTRQLAVKTAISMLTDAGVHDPVSQVSRPELLSISLIEAEVERQAKRYQELGFHKRLRMSAGGFKDSVMSLVVPQPEVFKGRFDISVVAFGQIPTKDQAKLVGIEYYLDGLKVSDWESDPQGYKTPDRTYLTWMQDGRVNLGKSVRDVRAGLASDERGATIQDAVGLYVAHPEVLNDHHIDLPGTSVESGDAALLGRWVGGPGLRGSHIGNPFSSWGSASSGRV